MTRKEWLAHSEEWREGYRAFTFNWTIVNFGAKTQEWKDGFNYAACTTGERIKPVSGGENERIV